MSTTQLNRSGMLDGFGIRVHPARAAPGARTHTSAANVRMWSSVRVSRARMCVGMLMLSLSAWLRVLPLARLFGSDVVFRPYGGDEVP
jgi:hypothetical protein